MDIKGSIQVVYVSKMGKCRRPRQLPGFCGRVGQGNVSGHLHHRYGGMEGLGKPVYHCLDGLAPGDTQDGTGSQKLMEQDCACLPYLAAAVCVG